MLTTLVAYIRALIPKPSVQILFVIMSGCLAYSNSFHGPFVFDDINNIVFDRNLENISTYLASSPFKNPRWFALATFAINKGIGGSDVTGFHVINLIIHVLTGLSVYALVVTTLRSFGEKNVRRYSFAPVIASLAFVLHPLHTQSVTYIVQRMTSLASLLYLTTILMYARCFAENSSKVTSNRVHRPVLYLLSVIVCLLAMSTKEISFTLPAALMLFDICFLKGSARSRALRLVPFFLCTLVLIYSLVGMDRSLGVLSHGRVDDFSHPVPRKLYLITQLPVLCTYLRLLILPIGQNLDYDYPIFYSLFQPQPAAAFVLLASLLLGGIVLLSKSFSNSQSPEILRIAGFAVIWFFLTVSVESWLVTMIDRIFEHRVYLPSVWFFVVFALLVCELYQRAVLYRKAVVTIVIALLVLSGYATYLRNYVWRDALTLWSDVVAKSPEKERGWTSLGVYYVNNREPAKATPFLERAVQINADYELAQAWLALALMQQGEHDRALYHAKITTRIAPEFSKGWEIAGQLLLEMGDVKAALLYLSRALEIDPNGFVSQMHLQKAMDLDRQKSSPVIGTQ